MSNSEYDPLALALQPPLDESPLDRAVRLEQEALARRVSLKIDESIKLERQLQKKKNAVRLLLLGQSESGKSTTLKQFQRLYTPTAFRQERHLWRAIVQLNILRSVRIVIETITAEHRSALLSDDEDNEDENITLTPELRNLIKQLLPLRHIENILIAKLIPPNEDAATHLGNNLQHRSNQEIFVRPGVGLHNILLRGLKTFRPTSAGTTGIETEDEPQAVLHSCRYNLISLWQNPIVSKILKRRRVRLEELPGFYLNDLERLTSLNYMPSDDDVLKARLKTVGVCEYSFKLESAAGADSGTEWRIIDVGGSRSQRPTWVQFFDDVDAILFLAPISCFDQTLTEDRSVNRFEDSVLLWKLVCSNKLLAKVELVLFLNKCDLLDSKLNSGVKLCKYVRSYGNRSNDAETASKYFRGKFSAIQRESSPHPRKFYGFCTSVTDTSTTAGILSIVSDIVLRQQLKRTRLL